MAVDLKTQTQQITGEAVDTVRGWFQQMQALPAVVRDMSAQDARDLFEKFKDAGIQRADQIKGGESVQKLMEATGKTVDGLMSAMRKCPFGKQMPALGQGETQGAKE
jgi:hypothetical protein